MILFWGLRTAYWSRTNEEPFSDILDYIIVARQIAEHFTFGLPPDRLAYWTPVTPSAIALAMIVGGDHYETVYRFLVQGLVCAGSLFLGYELSKLTGRRWAGVAFLLIVAICRPSIFWSYKLSTEGLTEALLYLTSASSLRAIRLQSVGAAFAAGMIVIVLSLNRAQYAAPALILPILIGLSVVLTPQRLRSGPRGISAEPRTALRAGATMMAAAFLGLILAWSPWIVRNYAQFGTLVPFSTTGYESFLWETGGGPLTPGRYEKLQLSDGSVVREFGIRALQRDAMRYPREIDRRDYLGRIAAAWMSANAEEYPALVMRRLQRLMNVSGTSGLTRVPRETLFTTLPAGLEPMPSRRNITDRLLLDKHIWAVWAALAGHLIMIIVMPAAGLVLACLWVGPWFTTALVIGAERAVESLIAVAIWMAFYSVCQALLLMHRGVERLRNRSMRRTTPSI